MASTHDSLQIRKIFATVLVLPAWFFVLYLAFPLYAPALATLLAPYFGVTVETLRGVRFDGPKISIESGSLIIDQEKGKLSFSGLNLTPSLFGIKAISADSIDLSYEKSLDPLEGTKGDAFVLPDVSLDVRSLNIKLALQKASKKAVLAFSSPINIENGKMTVPKGSQFALIVSPDKVPIEFSVDHCSLATDLSEGEVAISLPKTLLEDHPATLQLLNARSSDKINPLKGKASARGTLVISNGRIDKERSTIQIELGIADLRVDGASLKDLSIKGEFRPLLNYSTISPFVVEAEEADFGVPLKETSIQLEMSQEPGSRIKVNYARTNVLNGEASVAPTTFNLRGSSIIPIKLKAIDLREVFRLYGDTHVSGEGRLSAEVELKLDTEKLPQLSGPIRSDGPGVLHAKLPKDALGDTLQFVPEILENFRFSSLDGEFTSNDKGDLKLALRIEGSNPSIENGRPLKLNLNIEENLPALLKSLQISNKLNKRIEEGVK